MEDIWTKFNQTVNMTARELEKWLETEQSQSVEQKRGSGESTGRASGRRIVAILRSKRADLGDDYAHMREAVGCAKRHLAKRPRGDVSETAWHYSLMNWGHDPTRT